jgi:uncharacterized protein
MFRMSLIINLLDAPPGGLQIDHEVEGSALSLSPHEGMVIGSVRCSGNIFLPDERSAYFQGMISGMVSRECVRCLTLFEESLSVPCEAEFQKPLNANVPKIAKGKGIRRPDVSVNEDVTNEDVYPIAGTDIDLLPAIREHVILATPLQSLCREDCLGLCQVCGANLNEGVCACCRPVTASSPIVPFRESLSRKNQSKRSSATAQRGS